MIGKSTYTPSTSFTVRLNSWNPCMSSCSLLPRPGVYCIGYCRVLLRPKLLASAESPLLKECVDIAHLEFLRITDVTERISESSICFKHTGRGIKSEVTDSEAMLGFRRVAFSSASRSVLTSKSVESQAKYSTCHLSARHNAHISAYSAARMVLHIALGQRSINQSNSPESRSV